VRDTSRRPLFWSVRHPIQATRDLVAKWTRVPSPLENMVLEPALENRLSTIAWTTINARKNRYYAALLRPLATHRQLAT